MRRPPLVAPYALLLLATLSSCAHVPPGPSSGRDATDSTLVGAWHMEDEINSNRLWDSGPFALHGVVGDEVRTDQGYQGMSKVFNGSPDAFVYIPHAPVVDNLRTMVVEAWIQFAEDPQESIQTIAARWSPKPEEQSWVFLVAPASAARTWVGLPSVSTESKPLHFVMKSDRAPAPLVFSANGDVRFRMGWNHVAVSIDGERVAFLINGELDSSFPCQGGIARTKAALTFGNLVEVTIAAGDVVWYRGHEGFGFDGKIDELKISTIARAKSQGWPASVGR